MIWIVAGSILLLMGTVLVLLGWRGRVVGDEPFCRRCRHNLTGLTSNQCPECGAAVSREAVQWGLRRRRRTPLIAGLLLNCMVLTVVGLYLAKVSAVTNWYTWAPVWMLLDMGERKDVKAIRELVSRFEDDKLKGKTLAKAITVALDQHEKVPEDIIASEWADLLAAYDLSIGLTQEQRDRFYTNVVPSMEMIPRSVVREGDPMVYVTRAKMRGSPRLDSLLRWAYVEDRSSGFIPSDVPWKVHKSYWHDFQFRFFKPNRDLVTLFNPSASECGVQVQVWKFVVARFGNPTNSSDESPDWRRDFSIFTSVDVLAKQDADPIVLLSIESLENYQPPVIMLMNLSRSDERLSATLDLVKPVDWCLAYEVIAIIGYAEIRMGQVVWEAGASGHRSTRVLGDLPGLEAFLSFEKDRTGKTTELVIELQPSREAAARVLNCYQVLDEKNIVWEISRSRGRPNSSTGHKRLFKLRDHRKVA